MGIRNARIVKVLVIRWRWLLFSSHEREAIRQSMYLHNHEKCEPLRKELGI